MSKSERLLSFVVMTLLLCSCASIMPFGGVSDKAKIDAAKAELATVKTALGMYQAEDDYASYPSNQMISSHSDLIRILSPYVRLPDPPNASWTFVSYTSAMRDTFVLKGRAKDRKGTLLIVTPTELTPPP